MKKTIIIYLEEFLLSLFLFLFILSFTFTITIFSKNYVLKSLTKANYYSLVYDETMDDMKNYLLQSGLDESILNNIFTVDNVKNDTISLLGVLYTNDKTNIDTSYISTNLNNNINNYYAEKSLTLDNTAISKFTEQMEDVYQTNVLFKSYNIPHLTKVIKYNRIILFFSFIISIILTLLLFKNKAKTKQIVLETTLILLVILKYFVLNKIDINNLILFSNSFTVFCRVFFQSVSQYFLGSIIILLILIVSSYFFKINKH